MSVQLPSEINRSTPPAALTARAGGGKATALLLSSTLNLIGTVATAGDSLLLPPSTPGAELIIINNGANPLQVFGSGTDTINAIATGTGISQGAGTIMHYYCGLAGAWVTSSGAGANSLPLALTANGAIPPHSGQTYVITKAGVLADTLAAPTAGADDGIKIIVASTTAFAHTLTATGLLQTGSASVNLATFAAQAGAGLTLMAYNGKWIVLCSVGITFS